MNAHARLRAVKPAEPHPSWDLEEDICHLAREARAAEIMAGELISLLKAYGQPGFSGEGVAALTSEAQELLEDFSGRVARCATNLRVRYYGGAR